LIYFIQAGDTEPIKIGYAARVGSRVRELQTSHSETLRVLAVMDGDRRFEAQIHEKFASLRTRGEWFMPGPDLVAFIASHGREWDATKPPRRFRQPCARTEKEMQFRRDMAAYVVAYMRERGLTQSAFGKLVGLDRQTVVNIVAAKFTTSGYAMMKLTEALGADFLNAIYRPFGIVAARAGTPEAKALQAVNRLAPALDALAEMAVA
jgi:DNA-binding XRE family transcriptional regulator